MAHGLRARDTSGNSVLITPETESIVASGTVSMPTTLQSDSTYGASIDLPGAQNYNAADIGVMILTRAYSLSMQLQVKTMGTDYHYMRFIYNPGVYYTRNISTGVMTEWVEEVNKDTVYNEFPHFFWEKKSGSTFTSVQLFACVAFLCRDVSAGVLRMVYRIDSIAAIDYVVYLKRYNLN